MNLTPVTLQGRCRHIQVKGYQRDTVYFSILDDEWPAVKARLEARLARHFS
jgi:hypothetical protein